MAVRRILTGVTGALLTPLLLVSACGGGGSSVADPPVSPTTASSSPTGAPHRETPKAFIRRWAEAEMKMENTGDTTQYLALSRGCGPCMKLAAQVSGYYAAGGYVKWGGWQILSIKRYSSGPTVQYSVHAKSRRTQYKESAGAPVKRFSGGPITYVLELTAKKGSWVVTNKSELQT